MKDYAALPDTKVPIPLTVLDYADRYHYLLLGGGSPPACVVTQVFESVLHVTMRPGKMLLLPDEYVTAVSDPEEVTGDYVSKLVCVRSLLF